MGQCCCAASRTFVQVTQLLKLIVGKVNKQIVKCLLRGGGWVLSLKNKLILYALLVEGRHLRRVCGQVEGVGPEEKCGWPIHRCPAGTPGISVHIMQCTATQVLIVECIVLMTFSNCINIFLSSSILLSFYLSVCLSKYLSNNWLNTYLSIYLNIYLSIYIFIYIYNIHTYSYYTIYILLYVLYICIFVSINTLNHLSISTANRV